MGQKNAKKPRSSVRPVSASGGDDDVAVRGSVAATKGAAPSSTSDADPGKRRSGELDPANATAGRPGKSTPRKSAKPEDDAPTNKKAKKDKGKKSDDRKSDDKAKGKKSDDKKAGGKKAGGRKSEGRKAKDKKSGRKASKGEPPAASTAGTGRRKGSGSGSAAAPLPAPRRAGLREDGAGLSARVALRAPSGASAPDLPTDRIPGFGPKDEAEALKWTAKLADRIADYQERLRAQGSEGSRERVLLILQGMDTSGKDGTTKAVFRETNPLGLHLVSFKKPTAEELAHDFLWRIEKQVPEAGLIGVFNRSQYEDVLIVRVHEMVPRSEWSRRYAAINAFERSLARQGVTVVKCFLHVSKEVQKERLAARLDDPEKWWKFNPGDIDERAHWDDYQRAYTDVLRRCHTVGAPWHVIPADHKWYRNWAVAALLTEVLAEIDPRFPPASFDVEAEKARLAEA